MIRRTRWSPSALSEPLIHRNRLQEGKIGPDRVSMRLPSLRICAYPDPSAHREGRYGTRKAERLAEAGDPIEGAGRDRRCGSAAAQPGGQQGLGSYPQEQSAESPEQA